MGRNQGGGGGDGIEGLMKGLKLSEERNGMRGEWRSVAGEESKVAQAVGKLFSGKAGYADGMAQSLGKIWCPLKGIRCKELGDNFFLFSFLQPSGKRRATTEGPWEFGGDLLIVVDFDEKKRLKDLEFIYTPVWIRVFDLPLGMMNEATGRKIGDKVGKTLEVDAEDDGSAIGRYLRIKVRLDVRKPLLRDCDDYGGRDEKQQFGEWLTINPSRRRIVNDNRSKWPDGGSSGRLPKLKCSDNSNKSQEKEITKSKTSLTKESSWIDRNFIEDGTTSDPQKPILEDAVNEDTREDLPRKGQSEVEFSHSGAAQPAQVDCEQQEEGVIIAALDASQALLAPAHNDGKEYQDERKHRGTYKRIPRELRNCTECGQLLEVKKRHLQEEEMEYGEELKGQKAGLQEQFRQEK
ncbi:unnamed protein product [Miscanthus lutarioriparius]|uniref:DUF4283 domain-containing protein n=1 Tax=Miscanthus lutarioriparius TaxID=422564 RepID=A0A811R6V2_9POAL|nr:unnamed protein product [Miscanthus lutarioriparius]